MRDLEERLRQDFASAMADLPTDPAPHPSVIKARRPQGRSAAAGRRPAARRPLLALAAAGATAAALVAPTVLPLGGPPPGTAAAAVLAQAADRAAAATLRPTAAAGQFLYFREVGSQENANGPAGRCGVVYERWIPADGAAAGRIVRLDGVSPPAPGWKGDRTALAPQEGCYQGVLDVPDTGPTTGTWQTPTARFVATLPTDPRALYERAAADVVRDGHGDKKDQETFVYLADLLGSGSPYLSPTLKSAVYRAMALIPGVQNLGATTDLLGRQGTALAGPEDRDDTLILDPRTGEVLGEGGPYEVARTYAVVGDTRTRPSR
jgi:hypothetical protein